MFTHLHVHTQYSMLDGAIRIGDLIEKTKEYGMNAVAVTDHGAMYGALEFYTKAKKAGLRPIIGCELYIAETDHLIHDKSAGHNFHLVLLAMNEDGYRNLMKLASVAQTAGFYYKPRIDRRLLADHHEGLIALSACLHGEVPWLISHSGMDAAREKALELRQLFGDRLYFEVQENGIPEQRKVNAGLQELGHDLGIKLVATNDCHYLNKDEAYAHEVLLCIQTSKVISDPGRFKFSTDELYFKPPDVMARQFSWCPEALSNTMEVAERCDLKLKFGENHFPIFPVPAGESLESLFEHACRDGLEKRLALLRELQEVSPELEAQYRERLEMEIKVIQKMGFSGYFLIVADFINWAKSKGIPVGPGRGCIIPDTKVLLADGREVTIQEIEANDQVVTHLGNVFPVRKTMAYDCDEELVQIEAANEVLSLTQDHKVWAVRSETCTVDSAKTRSVVCKPTCPRCCSQSPCTQYRPEWISAGQLRKNDFVVFPRTVSKNKDIVFDLLDFVERKPYLVFNEDSLCYVIGTNRIPTKKLPRHVPFDDNLAKLLGYYIAEGWSRLGERRCGIGFGFHKKETAYAEEVQQLLRAVFGLESKVVPHKTRNALQVISHSKIVGEFLTAICGIGANQKHIPFQLISHGKDGLLKTLIAYLFRGDGHDGACNATISIKYSTTSPVLASQLRLLLARFGYWTTLLRREKEQWATEFSVKLAGRQLLGWNQDFPAFPIEQGQQLFYRNDSFYADGRAIYLKIRKVSRSPYHGKVYDISVPPDTSYVANSLAIHNSGAGSLAAYCMAITDIDPIPYDLLFERFLNVERVSMPDFDVDFCKDRRDEVIDYVRQKYGGDAHVAQIVAYGSMKARAVLRDVGRVLEIPLPQVDRIAKLVPEELKITLKKAIEQEPRLREAMREESIQKLLKVAQTLEGLARHKSTHAAGVVISPKPMVEYLPVCIGPDKEILTQYDMKYTEMTGLIKFDFLGLKTLTVIDRALKLIKQDIGLDVHLNKLPTDDQKTYDLLCAGSSLGVFQLESDGMRELLIKMAPEQFTDLIALVALYRPGPLDSGMVDQFVETKHGRMPAEYPLPQIKEVLRETYGVIVYQEQVMKISNILASYSLGDADILRRAMGKKIPEEMEKERGKFMAGAKVNGIPEERAAYVFDLMAKFAGYGFNKSHSAAYALVAYHTAYLKAHYPAQFLAALLSCDVDNTDKVVRYINECRQMGIEVLPPDINESYHDFTVIKDRIRFGLAAVKAVGGAALDSVIEERRKTGPYTSLADFCGRVDASRVNRKVLENLIKAGAFDSMRARRAQLMEVLDKTIEQAKTVQRDRMSGQMSLFSVGKKSGGSSPAAEIKLPDMDEWQPLVKLGYEKETVGFFLTGHPLDGVIDAIRLVADSDLAAMESWKEGQLLRVGGLIQRFKEHRSKKGDRMAFTVLEDMTASVEVIVFPDTFAQCSHLLGSEQPLIVQGAVQVNERGANLIADSVLPLNEAMEQFAEKAVIRLRSDRIGRPQLTALKDLFYQFHGTMPVKLTLHFDGRGEADVEPHPDLRVRPCPEFCQRVQEQFGRDCLFMQIRKPEARKRKSEGSGDRFHQR
jgi:DNA polymerase III alpha subunit